MGKIVRNKRGQKSWDGGKERGREARREGGMQGGRAGEGEAMAWQFERTQITLPVCVALSNWKDCALMFGLWRQELSPQSVGTCSLSVSQDRAEASFQRGNGKLKRPTSDRQGWETSISWPSTTGTQMFWLFQLEGRSEEIYPHSSSLPQYQNGSCYASFLLVTFGT